MSPACGSSLHHFFVHNLKESDQGYWYLHSLLFFNRWKIRHCKNQLVGKNLEIMRKLRNCIVYASHISHNFCPPMVLHKILSCFIEEKLTFPLSVHFCPVSVPDQVLRTFGGGSSDLDFLVSWSAPQTDTH